MAYDLRYNVMHFDKEYTGYSDVFVTKYGKLYTDAFADSVLQCFDQILETKKGHNGKLSFCIADFGTADGGMILGIMNKLIEDLNNNLLHTYTRGIVLPTPHCIHKVEEVNDLKNGLSSTVTKCIPNLTISGFIGDVHPVSHDMVVRRYGQKADVTIIFEDQPLNDYNALIKKITGNGSRLGLRQSENVHVLVSGTSMYRRCLKSDELDLCLSSTALHWLSKKPCNIENSVQSDCGSDFERMMFGMQAEEDWKKFLDCRGKELKSNGRMVLLIPCGANFVPGGFHTFTSALKELIQSGKITENEFLGTTFMFDYRTEKELRKPFSENDSSVAENRLELLDFRSHNFLLVSGLNGVQCKDQKTVDTYAEAIINLVKPWAYNTFYCGLSEERKAEERHGLVNEYFDILRKLIINSDSFPDIVSSQAEVVIRKQ